MTIGSNEGVRRFKLSASQVEIARDEETEYVVDSELLILDKDSDNFTVIIHSPMEVMHADFHLTDIDDPASKKIASSIESLLFTMEPVEAARTFISEGLFDITDLQEPLLEHILTDRRMGKSSKAEATYLYYEVKQQIADARITLAEQSLTLLDPDYPKVVHDVFTAIYALEKDDGNAFGTTFCYEFVESVKRDLVNSIMVAQGFSEVIWTPFIKQLETLGVKSSIKPTLTVVK